jgi:hypothetical protein
MSILDNFALAGSAHKGSLDPLRTLQPAERAVECAERQVARSTGQLNDQAIRETNRRMLAKHANRTPGDIRILYDCTSPIGRTRR